MDVELIADIGADDLDFATGAARIVDLLQRLQRLPAFSGGWHLPGGARLDDGAEGFIAQAAQDVGPDEEDVGMFHLIARAARAAPSAPEPYLLSAQFGRSKVLPLHINLGVRKDLARLELMRDVTAILLDWQHIQHVKIADPWYAMEDAPVDPRRRGIGWAGWVAFALTSDQVPEAVVLEPMAHGTFLASMHAWDTAASGALAPAQNLELRLNALGVLPTFDDLASGDWGRRAE